MDRSTLFHVLQGYKKNRVLRSIFLTNKKVKRFWFFYFLSGAFGETRTLTDLTTGT